MVQDSVTEGSPPDRDDILAMLHETMEDVRKHIAGSDPETPDKEALQIKWIRALGYLAGQYRMLKRDADLDEMEEQLELLEQATDVEPNP